MITALRSGDQKAFKLLVDIYKRTGYNTVPDFVQHTENAGEASGRASRAFKGDNNLLLISHAVTLIRKRQYAEKLSRKPRHHQPNWHLVTGSKVEIYTIARKGYFADSVTNSAITTTFFAY